MLISWSLHSSAPSVDSRILQDTSNIIILITLMFYILLAFPPREMILKEWKHVGVSDVQLSNYTLQYCEFCLPSNKSTNQMQQLLQFIT